MTFPLTSLIAIAVATGITSLAMLLVARFEGKQDSHGFLRNTLPFMGSHCPFHGDSICPDRLPLVYEMKLSGLTMFHLQIKS